MRRWLRRAVAAGALVLMLTAISVTAAAYIMQQRHGHGRSLDQPVDAAIVLGSGIDPDGVINYPARRRVATGVNLLRAGKVERLIMSGGMIELVGTSAGAMMRDHALSLGAPEDAILVEGKARTTAENLQLSFRLARQAGLSRLAIVTDDFHLLRASWLARYFGECGIDLVSVRAVVSEPWYLMMRDITRESAAWWYNLGKVALWSARDALGLAGTAEDRTAR